MNKILMVTPEFFDVEYVINPHMKDSEGKLNQIDHKKAQEQWQKLREKYTDLGMQVELIEGIKGLPDMVFAANQSFVWWDNKKQKPSVLMSQMKSSERQGEVCYFKKWYIEHGYLIYELDSRKNLEGNGDLLWNRENQWVLGGFGFRTDIEAINEIEERFKLNILKLKLINPDFYHLDTCLSFLNKETVLIYPEAFTHEGLKELNVRYKNIIEVDLQEAKFNFACNCHCPNGKDVIIQSGSTQVERKLKARGFAVHAIDTSEFLKSGGSIFCMKMQLF